MSSVYEKCRLTERNLIPIGTAHIHRNNVARHGFTEIGLSDINLSHNFGKLSLNLSHKALKLCGRVVDTHRSDTEILVNLSIVKL